MADVELAQILSNPQAHAIRADLEQVFHNRPGTTGAQSCQPDCSPHCNPISCGPRCEPSSNRDEVASALAVAIAPSFRASDDPMPLEGTTLHIDLSGFTRTGPETAAVPVTIAGPTPGKCDLLLVFEDSRWAVYSTTDVH